MMKKRLGRRVERCVERWPASLITLKIDVVFFGGWHSSEKDTRKGIAA
jgi:hypothetical protein